MSGHPGRVLGLNDYRALVALDEPFAPPPALDAGEGAAVLSRVVRHLGAECTIAQLQAGPGQPIPPDSDDWLRALLTVRAPAPLPDDVQSALDRWLRTQALLRPLVAANDLPRLAGPKAPPLDACALWQGDITTLEVDAIVNAANADLL